MTRYGTVRYDDATVLSDMMRLMMLPHLPYSYPSTRPSRLLVLHATRNTRHVACRMPASDCPLQHKGSITRTRTRTMPAGPACKTQV
eukprot:scaffold290378_cov16-Prasinocladus_malaysianus.AAC.2